MTARYKFGGVSQFLYVFCLISREILCPYVNVSKYQVRVKFVHAAFISLSYTYYILRIIWPIEKLNKVQPCNIAVEIR